MKRFIAVAVAAVAALTSSSASAEPPEEVASSNCPSGGLAAELEEATEADTRLVLALVFTLAEGPRRLAPALSPAVDVEPAPSAVFNWVSPVFVWIEPGYAYAETTLSF